MTKLDTLIQRPDVVESWRQLNLALARLPASRKSAAIYSFIHNATAFSRAKWFGAALVDAIAGTQGAPRATLWGKEGVWVRVYFRDAVGFLSVGSDGSLSESSRGKRHQGLHAPAH